MSDMIDVLHYLFEHDSTSISSGEQLEARDKVRENLYRTMYGVRYKYSTPSKSSSGAYDAGNVLDLPVDEEDIPAAFDPMNSFDRPKSFIPPTDFNPDSASPFGSALDAPLR
jgi:hypothetical protein